MQITVCVKQVPDTGTERELRPGDALVDRDAADAVINELDEFAIEEGIRLAEKHGGQVTILSMGPERAAESVRKALAMGADQAVHVCDPYGYDMVEASLPAVVSVVEKINEPRYPSFKGIMAAKKKPVQVLTLADLGLTEDQAGLAGSATEVTGFRKRPPRQTETIVDEGQGGIGAADYLAARKFI
jgi:electron transfer flavoprotein alpha/beta subunit